MTARALMAGLLLTLTAPMPLQAQNGEALFAEGVRAYRALAYHTAIAVLRRAIAATPPNTMHPDQRPVAFTYLGASELFLDRPAKAAEAFRRALETSPRHRPDTLVFPPAVTAAFEEARHGTTYASIRVPPDTTIVPGRDGYPVRVHVSAPHELEVVIVDPSDRRVRVLHTGEVRDSLDVVWNGQNDTGAPADGTLTVRVTPLGTADPRSHEQHLEIRLLAAGTGPVPAQPAGPPARSRSFGPLAGGLLAAAAVVALPALIDGDSPAAPERWAIGVTVGLGGILGFLQGGDAPAPPPVAVREAAPPRLHIRARRADAAATW